MERRDGAIADDEVLAVVVAGSLTKEYGHAESDVDGFVITTDEGFVRPTPERESRSVHVRQADSLFVVRSR